jgi:hypothetical protein
MTLSAQMARAIREEVAVFAAWMSKADPERRSDPRSLPPEAAIAAVLEEVFWASVETEEGKPCLPRLLYAPDSAADDAHVFRETLPLRRDALRKVAGAHGPGGFLTWCLGDAPTLTGIHVPQAAAPMDLTIVACKPGALDVGWSGIRLVTLRAGKIERMSRCALPNHVAALDVITKMTGGGDPLFLWSMIRTVREGQSGGAIWISASGEIPSRVRIGYGVRPTSDHADRRLPQRERWLQSIAHLTGVDGAVLLDAQLRVLGFGCFVDLSEPVPVVVQKSDGGRTEGRSDALGGGRHRSAAEFCRLCAPAAAIVVSEDGRVLTLAAAEPRSPVWCGEIAALGPSDLL